VTRMLERRVRALTQWPIQRIEPCSIISYQPGDEYKPHVDYFTSQLTADERETALSTLMFYVGPGAGNTK